MELTLLVVHTSPTYSPTTQEALETMAARVLLSAGVIRVMPQMEIRLRWGGSHNGYCSGMLV